MPIPFVVAPDQTSRTLNVVGENITVRRFARFKVGAPDWTVAQTKAVEAAAE